MTMKRPAAPGLKQLEPRAKLPEGLPHCLPNKSKNRLQERKPESNMEATMQTDVLVPPLPPLSVSDAAARSSEVSCPK